MLAARPSPATSPRRQKSGTSRQAPGEREAGAATLPLKSAARISSENPAAPADGLRRPAGISSHAVIQCPAGSLRDHREPARSGSPAAPRSPNSLPLRASPVTRRRPRRDREILTGPARRTDEESTPLRQMRAPPGEERGEWLRGRISPEQLPRRKRWTTALRQPQEKCPAPRELCPREQGNGQRVMDAPSSSPAAAGLPREFPGREACSP